MSVFLTFVILSAHAEEAAYEVKFTLKLQKAYFEIQKLRIQPARELVDDERKTNATNPFIQYLDSYADLHYLLISEDKSAYKAFIESEDLRLDLIGKLPDSSPFTRFLQAEIRLHCAFAKMKYGNEVSGAWDVIKAYKLLEENRKKFPDFVPTLKSLGLLHVMIGSVPESYTWVTKILGLKGNINLGVKEIEKVVKDEPFFRQESQLIDLLIHAYILQLSETQLDQIKQLPKTQPDNLLLHFFATTILMKEGKSREASYYLNKAPTGPAYIPFPFLNYLQGEIALQQGKYEAAFNHYILFQKNYKGFNFIKDSNLKLFMCKWLANQDGQAKQYIQLISKKGATIVEGDKFAQRISDDFTSGKLSPEKKVLFQARYATDGGYLEEASELMAAVSEKRFSDIEDKTEFNYRRGRIYQKQGREDAAIPFYERTMSITPVTAQGLGASAALQLGYIFRDRKERDKSIAYFRKALAYKKYEYKNSVDNKARAALTELGQ